MTKADSIQSICMLFRTNKNLRSKRKCQATDSEVVRKGDDGRKLLRHIIWRSTQMNITVKPVTIFLSVDQVAQRYGVSTDSIWRWKREGKFPAPVRVGSGITRWRLADLVEHESTLQACCAMSLEWLDAA